MAIRVYRYGSNGSAERPTNACAIAEEMAFMKRKIAVTIERMFLGALVKAYSRPVIEAKISEKAMKR